MADSAGSRMWLVFALGAVLLLGACVPAATDADTASGPVPNELTEGAQWTATVLGVPINYRVVSEFEPRFDGTPRLPDEMPVPVLMYTVHDACHVDLHTSFLGGQYPGVVGLSESDMKYQQAYGLSGSVGLCLLLAVDPDAEVQRNEFDMPATSGLWGDRYMAACGDLLQPLGIPIGDGECDVPAIESVLIPLDG